jgi:hypothetical protein
MAEKRSVSALRHAIHVFVANASPQIMNKALTDIAYVQSLKGHVGDLVVHAYVQCLEYTHGMLP